MSYTPTNWATGDVITAEKLNNMEDGIVKAGSVYPVGMTIVQPEQDEDPIITLQKTFGEIKSAVEYGSIVVVIITQSDDSATITAVHIPENILINSGGGGSVTVNGRTVLAAETDNDYPTNNTK